MRLASLAAIRALSRLTRKSAPRSSWNVPSLNMWKAAVSTTRPPLRWQPSLVPVVPLGGRTAPGSRRPWFTLRSTHIGPGPASAKVPPSSRASIVACRRSRQAVKTCDQNNVWPRALSSYAAFVFPAFPAWALGLAAFSAIWVRRASAFFSSWSVASSSLATSFMPSCVAQAFSIP